MPQKKTNPGAMDDNATKRARENKKKKSDMLRKIFDDNESNRYGPPVDK